MIPFPCVWPPVVYHLHLQGDYTAMSRAATWRKDAYHLQIQGDYTINGRHNIMPEVVYHLHLQGDYTILMFSWFRKKLYITYICKETTPYKQ